MARLDSSATIPPRQRILIELHSSAIARAFTAQIASGRNVLSLFHINSDNSPSLVEQVQQRNREESLGQGPMAGNWTTPECSCWWYYFSSPHEVWVAKDLIPRPIPCNASHCLGGDPNFQRQLWDAHVPAYAYTCQLTCKTRGRTG